MERSDDGDGLRLIPFVRVNIAYEFDRAIDDSFPSRDLEDENPSRWRGSTELGIQVDFSEQVIIDLEGGYDGIGESDYDIWSFRGAIRIPLN